MKITLCDILQLIPFGSDVKLVLYRKDKTCTEVIYLKPVDLFRSLDDDILNTRVEFISSKLSVLYIHLKTEVVIDKLRLMYDDEQIEFM